MEESVIKKVVEIQEHLEAKVYGKYRGVARKVDKTNGMIQAEVPAVYGSVLTPWAYPCAPFAGDKHGLVLMPEPGDAVWIEFEAGNIAVPIWSGGWWAQGELPALATDQVRVLATTAGLQVILDEQNKEIKLQVSDQGPTLTMNSKVLKLEFSSGTEISLDSSAITLKIGSSKVELSSSGVKINDGAMEVS